MPERGPPLAVARSQGRRTRGLIALAAALTLLVLAGASASAGAATVAQQLAALPTIQPFNGEATSLSQFGSRWSVPSFAVEKGRETARGWSAAWAYPNVNGAYYNAASYTAATGGAAAAVTMAANPETQSRNFSLWLDMPAPGSAKSGYELRLTWTAEETFTVTLSKWSAGVQTVLASQTGVTFNDGNALAITDEGATVSAWTNTGAGFTQLLRATDATFNAGSVGVGASGNASKLTAFKAGQLAPAAPALTRTNPASPADDNSPFVIGTATSGTTVKLYTDATCRGSVAATGTAAAFASPGLQVSVADNTTTSFYATATDNLNNVSDCSTAISYTERTVTSGIGAALARLPQLDAFASAENPLSGGGRWTQLQWAGHPGQVSGSGTSGGWGPYNAFPTVHGAYWNPASFTDAGNGVAVAATLSVSPSATERYFALWLDMPEPGRAQSGYELRFTNVNGANSYDVTLTKWVSGTRTVLARSSAYTLAPQSSFALVDKGGVVSAWVDTGAGYAQLLTANDTTYSRGQAGIEGAGNITRVRQFRAGALPSETGALLATLPQLDAFATEEFPLSGGGRWTQLQWASHPGWVSGFGTSGGWGPWEAFPVVHGAYWNPTSFTDAGEGVAVAATLSTSPELTERYFSLWLDMSEPGRAKSGYELRFMQTATAGTYDVTLSKWVSGTRTVLATSSGYRLALQSSFALVDIGGTVSAWTDTGTGYGQLLSASDTAFSRGYAGIEGAGNITRVRQFRAGAVPSETAAMLANQPVVEAFATAESPLSGGGRWTQLSFASHPGRVAGSGTTGGWGPSNAFPTVNGAYWNPTAYGDEGSGAAVAATLSVSPSATERHFALWLDMPEPGRAQSGYELRFTNVNGVDGYDVTLTKWVSGTSTVLARQSAYTLAPQSSFALVDKGGTVSAWTDAGAGFAQLLSASDATYSRGYAGIAGAGNITRIRGFRVSGS